jgi:hypothetical protein
MSPPVFGAGITSRGNNMKLRDHPLVRHSWPPLWWWRAGGENKHLRGEVGTLREVRPYSIQPADRFYLIMQNERAEYLGVLLIEDYALRRQIFELLVQYCGRTIIEIGDIDLSHTL